MHRREEKELKRKEKVLAELDGLFQEWVRSCGRDVNIEDVHGKAVRGRLETSGTQLVLWNPLQLEGCSLFEMKTLQRKSA